MPQLTCAKCRTPFYARSSKRQYCSRACYLQRSTGPCSVVTCGRPVKSRGLCGMHYQRKRAGASMEAPLKRQPTDPIPECSADGCNRPVKTLHLCNMHYQRERKGVPMDAPTRVITKRGEPKPKCSVEGCERKYNGKGYCAMHSLRLARYGDVHRTGAWVLSETGLCTVEGCADRHLAKGLCHRHYYRTMHGRMDMPDTLTCARCGTEFPRPFKGNPRTVRFCTHECRYAEQLDGQRKNREALTAYLLEWYAKNPDKHKAHKIKRRAAMAGAESSHVTGRDLRRLIDRFRGLCAYCLARPYEHVDHVVPLARGGRHAIGNLLPACAKCNLAKGAKLLTEWRMLQPVPRRFRGQRARRPKQQDLVQAG